MNLLHFDHLVAEHEAEEEAMQFQENVIFSAIRPQREEEDSPGMAYKIPEPIIPDERILFDEVIVLTL